MNLSQDAFELLPKEGKVVSLNDYQLWAEFRSGDIKAYAAIYRKYFFVLYNYGRRMSSNQELVKDCVQDLFIKIWNNRENLKDTTSIRYYLLCSLRNKLLDALESPNTRLIPTPDFTEIDLVEGSPEENEFIVSQKEQIFRAMTKLSSHQRRALKLKFFEDHTNEEIATELNITTQSVYNLIFKSLRSLKKHIQVQLLILGTWFATM